MSLNPESAYEEAGRKAGQAQNHNDAATVKHWRTHVLAMLALERAEDKPALHKAYNDAYMDARRIARLPGRS